MCWILLFLTFCTGALVGCYQIAPGEDDLRAVPTTNHPHLAPQEEGVLPF